MLMPTLSHLQAQSILNAQSDAQQRTILQSRSNFGLGALCGGGGGGGGGAPGYVTNNPYLSEVEQMELDFNKYLEGWDKP